ncbi:MAG: hypothetical protein ABSA94_00795 [Acidobacteriaceae bacterium]|jgi:hypothetical protein
MSRISKFVSCLGLVSTLALTGCSSIKVHLGMRVRLDKLPITSMEATLPKDPAIAPGEKTPLVVTFTQPDGKTLVTEGQGKGKVLWSDLAIAASVVTVNKKGVVSLAHDPRVSDGKTGHLAITVPSHPDLHAELDIPLRYNYKFVANYSGSAGSSGLNGSDGTDGVSGSPGSTDPNNPSPGGNGSAGSGGSNGQDGDPGGDAPPVQVQATLRPGAHPLLQIAVTAPGRKEHFYLVDPQGGSLTVTANGGPGGSGGKGGRGGHGGAGGSGTPDGQAGQDGSDGRDGFSGPDGRGGSITVLYDPQVKPFLSTIVLSNQGGPKPIFQEQPIPPLW